MPGENPNDFNWKNKLEDVNNLPGDILADKNATWEKLHSRLQQKPRHRRVIWYWAAAACLLPAIITPTLILNKKHAGEIKNNSVQILTKKTDARQTSPLKEIVREDISSPLNAKKEPATTAKQTNTEKKLPKSILKKAGIETTVLADKKDLQPVQTIVLPPVADTPGINTVAAVSIKKKLKVVHINELGEPVEETHIVVRTENSRSFQTGLISQEIFTSSSLLLSNTGFNIFKTKYAPSN